MYRAEILVVGIGNIYIVSVQDEHKKSVGQFKIPVEELKKKGVLKRVDAIQKAERYLNSEEGFEYMTGCKKSQFKGNFNCFD